MGTKRRRIYQPPNNYKRIVLTQRDIEILSTIHAYDGLMSLKQLWRLFFPNCSSDVQPRRRLRDLCNNGYLTMPITEEALRWVPLGETIYWLDRNGASLVAGLQGQSLSRFKWSKKPRFSQIAHDLRVNDFRIAVRETCQLKPDLYLETWIPESEFSIQPDRISYETSAGKKASRTIRPDSYFTIERQPQFGSNKPFSFLLEIDMGSEDNPRFAREKVRPGIAYLKSSKYAERFGQPYGRYLVVTSGERRMTNMKAQTERNGGGGLFYFCTFADMAAEFVLTSPIWFLAGHEERRSIIPM